MRKRLWIISLATIFLLQACFPIAFAVSEKEITVSGITFCKSDTPYGGSGSTKGYHATLPENAESIKANGFRDSDSGRAGGGGVYVNNTPEGALAEFRKYYPDSPYTMIEVQYTPGTNVMIDNPGAHINGPLPINGDTLTFPSTQAPGTFNTIVRNGSIVIP